MPFQKRSIVRELVNPPASSDGSADTGVDFKRLIVDDPSTLFEFVNLDSFTEREVSVTMSMGFQEMEVEGFENIFESKCDSKHLCPMSKSLEPFYLYEKHGLPVYDVSDRILEKLEASTGDLNASEEVKTTNSTGSRLRNL